MFDAKQLLDQFLGQQAGGQQTGGQSGTGQSGRAPEDAARGAAQGVSGGNLAGALGGLTEGRFGGFAGGAAAGGLAALLLSSKSGRKLGKNALKLGGLAAVGALAYKAYQSYQAGQRPSGYQAGEQVLPPPSDSPFEPANQQVDETALVLLRAMIGAAKADGHIDAAERQKITQAMDRAGIGPEASDFIRREIEAPLDASAIAADVSSPEIAAEVYIASLMTIEPDQPSERAYLDDLARKLGLDTQLVAHLEATVQTAG